MYWLSGVHDSRSRRHLNESRDLCEENNKRGKGEHMARETHRIFQTSTKTKKTVIDLMKTSYLSWRSWQSQNLFPDWTPPLKTTQAGNVSCTRFVVGAVWQRNWMHSESNPLASNLSSTLLGFHNWSHTNQFRLTSFYPLLVPLWVYQVIL